MQLRPEAISIKWSFQRKLNELRNITPRLISSIHLHRKQRDKGSRVGEATRENTRENDLTVVLDWTYVIFPEITRALFLA